MQSKNTKEFLKVVDEFIEWVKSPPLDSKEEASVALLTLAMLYANSLLLMKVDVPREDSFDSSDCAITPDEWKEVHDRLDSLPFTYYRQCELPHESSGELVFVDIVEELTDIYQDIVEGKRLYEKGQHENALCHWQMTFENHWGRYCVGAMAALHSWFQNEADFEFV